MTELFDALVLGGGPAGSTAALLLARAGWSVALLERRTFPRRKVCGEYLSGTNRSLFAALDLLESFDAIAGPAVRRVGLFAGTSEFVADLPKPRHGWGRALTRDRLDTLLLDRAKAAGARVMQPCAAETLVRVGSDWLCSARPDGALRAPVVVAAHGSWDVGALPTQSRRVRPRASDLLAFKAHFGEAKLGEGLMPLIAFRGGYGGMVHVNGELVSLSCCVRRDRLAQLRAGANAGDVVENYLRESSAGVRRALNGAPRVGPWLAAGPIRPGARLRWPVGVFGVGNAAGEAHPIIAEGISMAMQSAWLLVRRLVADRPQRRNDDFLRAVAADYAQDWRRAFGPRLLTSRAMARWAMSAAALAVSRPLVRRLPAMLTWAALASGKITRVVEPVRSLVCESAMR